jgi:NitT/TauT family transport system permease protein
MGGADVVVLLATVGLFAAVASVGHDLWAPFTPDVPVTIELSAWHLPYYAARSLLRMVVALAVSLVFTLVVATWAAKSPAAGRVILPTLDVLQSVPVLGFLSATVTFFVALVPGHILGLELACLFAIFTSQVWNLTFAFYHVLLALPREQAEALRLFRVSGWRRFTRFEVPAAMIPLVWNAMMSFGGGWFFLGASEAITVLDREFLLPGLGSFMAVAVKRADGGALAWAVVTMVILILAVDTVFWRPLVAWTEKFKLEESEATAAPRSSVFTLLRRSRLLARLGGGVAALDERMDGAWRRWGEGPTRRRRAALERAMVIALWLVVGLFAILGAGFVATTVPWPEILHAAGLGAVTLLRVMVVVALAVAVWVPVGVWIGTSPRVARVAPPVVQVLASFPANFLFPLMAVAFLRAGVSLEWGGVLLMALGAQWYLLFNAVAGASAIPNDLREMARSLGVRGPRLWRALVLPAIFPAAITGALTAAGGAWNASIVAEIVRWGDATLEATGLGAYIAGATRTGDWPRIVLGVAVMSLYVVGTNRLVWRPLARLATARYGLTA